VVCTCPSLAEMGQECSGMKVKVSTVSEGGASGGTENVHCVCVCVRVRARVRTCARCLPL